MSTNLGCRAIYPNGATSIIPLEQTSADELCEITGCMGSIINHQGVEPYLSRYLERRLKRLVRSADTSLASDYLVHIQEITMCVDIAVSKGAIIEWYVI